MKILFYGAKDYDQQFFDRLHPDYPEIEITFIEANIYQETASLSAGYDGICVFVNGDLREFLIFWKVQTVSQQSPASTKWVLISREIMTKFWFMAGDCMVLLPHLRSWM